MPTSMATAQLSSCDNNFWWYTIGRTSGALTTHSVHPAAPVLLTRNGPLAAQNEVPAARWEPQARTHSEFESRPRAVAPENANHYL